MLQLASSMGARMEDGALRNRLPGLSISTSRPRAGVDDSRAQDQEPPEPVSPTARLVNDVYIVASIGLGAPLNLPVFRHGIETQLARYPRFRSIQVKSKDGTPQWVRTEVNVDSHIIIPTLDPAAVAADPDKAVEDYVASLSTLPMDHSRPAWEFHVLDVPTSEAAWTAALRVHHAFGDGVSLITLLIASARSAADPTRLPAMLPVPTRKGAVYGCPRPPLSAGALAFVVWVRWYLVLAWHTVLDLWFFVATIVFLRDPPTLFTRACNSEITGRRRRFVHRSLSLDDVKFLKNAINCTVNDVLVGVTSAALSRYYFRNSGDTRTSNLYVRSILVVNLRPTHSLQTYVNMIESGDSNDVKWGNRFGYIILPFHIAMHNDPLEYVSKAKKTVERKKRSLEVIFTNMVTEFTLKIFGAKAGAFIFNRMFKHISIGFSNVSGPTEEVVLCGHPVTFVAPSVYGPPQALFVHYQSYSSIMKVILAVDEALFPDYHQLLDDFSESLQLIKDAASSLPTTSIKND